MAADSVQVGKVDNCCEKYTESSPSRENELADTQKSPKSYEGGSVTSVGNVAGLRVLLDSCLGVLHGSRPGKQL